MLQVVVVEVLVARCADELLRQISNNSRGSRGENTEGGELLLSALSIPASVTALTSHSQTEQDGSMSEPLRRIIQNHVGKTDIVLKWFHCTCGMKLLPKKMESVT